MEILVRPRGVLEINKARICYRNFAGRAGKFNREGDRSFSLVIAAGTFDDGKRVYELSAQEMADALLDQGWNVKISAPHEEGDEPFIHLPVKIKCNERGPIVYLRSGRNQVKLDEESMEMLDEVYIQEVELDIRPFDWEVRGNTGRAAYLQSIRVTQDIRDRFAEEEYPME